MLRFIESTDHYSLYERRDGTEVFYGHGYPLVELVEYDQDWMLEQWQSSPLTGQRFLDWLRGRLIDPTVVDDLRLCEDCGEPTDRGDGYTVEGDAFSCDSCVDNYYSQCNDCDTYSRDATSTLNDDYVCQSCLDGNYRWCDECEGYYHHDYPDDHDHEEEGRCSQDCESPAMRFAIRNDGHGMLWNDQQVTVSLPAGTIDSEGIRRIRNYLRDRGYYTAASLVTDMDARWQTSEGNFTKRLSRAAYKVDGSKILAEDLSQVGSIAADQSKGTDFKVATTRDLNMSASDFGHDTSCWWGGYSSSRCSLKSNGGFGLRSFDDYGNVSGRAWVMPLKADERGNLRPTFNTETPDAFVVFNCYGNLSDYSATRILSHMAGMTYRKISFSCEPMFINSDMGYLIAPEEIATRYTDGSLHLSTDAHSDLHHTETRELVDAVA